jgi:hypothetical protein
VLTEATAMIATHTLSSGQVFLIAAMPAAAAARAIRGTVGPYTP